MPNSAAVPSGKRERKPRTRRADYWLWSSHWRNLRLQRRYEEYHSTGTGKIVHRQTTGVKAKVEVIGPIPNNEFKAIAQILTSGGSLTKKLGAKRPYASLRDRNGVWIRKVYDGPINKWFRMAKLRRVELDGSFKWELPA